MILVTKMAVFAHVCMRVHARTHTKLKHSIHIKRIRVKTILFFDSKTYNWLTSNFHKVSNIVVLVFLKGSKQHLKNTFLVITSLFTFCLLLLFIFNLREATKTK
jgi:hypothetical protein